MISVYASVVFSIIFEKKKQFCQKSLFVNLSSKEMCDILTQLQKLLHPLPLLSKVLAKKPKLYLISTQLKKLSKGIKNIGKI